MKIREVLSVGRKTPAQRAKRTAKKRNARSSTEINFSKLRSKERKLNHQRPIPPVKHVD